MRRNNKKLLYILLSLGIFSLSCKQNKIAYGTEVNTKDSIINVRKLVNHKLTEEIEYYYPNKELKSKVNFRNGEREGAYIEYYINGQISKKGTYKNGYLIDKYVLYSEKGQIGAIMQIESDSLQGEISYFYPDNLIRMYCLSDFDGELYYVIKWDSLGNKYYDEGVVFSPSIKCNYKLDSLPKDTPVEFYAAVSAFDNYNTIMKAGLSVNDLTQLELVRHKTTYSTKFNQVGMNHLIFLGVMYDSLGNIFKTDTTRISISVKE